MNPYPLVLLVHSWWRWAVVGLLLLALAHSFRGALGGRPFTPGDRALQRGAVAALDVQVLLGGLLYFVLSPLTPRSLEGLRAAMPVSLLRFFAVEHIATMLCVLLVVHVAAVRSRRHAPGPGAHRTWARGLALAALLVAVAIPWPGRPYGRPLLRWRVPQLVPAATPAPP
jgi:hypothetical protein